MINASHFPAVRLRRQPSIDSALGRRLVITGDSLQPNDCEPLIFLALRGLPLMYWLSNSQATLYQCLVVVLDISPGSRASSNK